MSSLKSKAEQILNLADVKINGNRPWDIQVYNEDFYKKIFSGGSLSLGESYMDGWWDCKNLDDFYKKVLDKKYMQYTCGYWKNAKNLDQDLFCIFRVLAFITLNTKLQGF